MASLDAPVLKEISEAVQDMSVLSKLLKPLVTPHGSEIDAAKLKVTALKVRKFLTRYAPLMKLAGSSHADKMADKTKAGLMWLDETMAEMLKLDGSLADAIKVAALDPAKNHAKIIKAMKAANSEAGKPSWSTTKIASVEKERQAFTAQKEKLDTLGDFLDGAKDFGGVEGKYLSSFGLVILLFYIWKYLQTRLTKLPK
jgi:hypothetical protein